MKILCRYSGLSFTATAFGTMSFQAEHPIMNAPVSVLLSRSKDWSQGLLLPGEKRLLFIAALKATELVTFEAPANPSPQTIALNMERLLKALAWTAYIGSKVHLPRYVVNEETSNLRNIHNWIIELGNARNEFYTSYWSPTLRNKIERREEALSRLINSATRNERTYARTLADWVLTATGADVNLAKDTCDHWRDIFMIRGNEYLRFSLVDMDEVLDYMNEKIPTKYMGTSFATAAYKHIHTIMRRKSNGDFFGLLEDGDGNLEELTFDPAEAIKHPYSLLPSNSPQRDAYDSIMNDTPLVVPVEKSYATKLEYLQAWMKYNTARKIKMAVEDRNKSAATTATATEGATSPADLTTNKPLKEII